MLTYREYILSTNKFNDELICFNKQQHIIQDDHEIEVYIMGQVVCGDRDMLGKLCYEITSVCPELDRESVMGFLREETKRYEKTISVD